MDPEMDVDAPEPRGTKRAAEEDEASKKPKRIRALDPDVVNKIAAGEIIVAPMHALKELIENAVDAGSTSLEILVKDGGLKLLQITDNGHGIDRDDLPILCERFTTSKLKQFEDLSSIGTYGFRGEALASISHIAHLTVTTKTAGSSCAWRAHYSNGKLVAPKPGQPAAPKATAGRGGTQITVEDLFYNVPTRRRAFRSANVNVHPTKREVNFLNEDEIIECICQEIKSNLTQVDSSRTFLTQTLLPGVRTMEPAPRDPDSTDAEGRTPKTPATTKKPYEHNLVRTDSKVRKITSMLSPAVLSATEAETTSGILDEGLQYETTDREPLRIALTSVKNLRASVRNAMHNMLTETIASHTYVGLVDERRRITAIQSGVKLYLIDYGMFCNEFFYQIGLTDFGNFGVIKLDPAPKLIDLLQIAADAEREAPSSRKAKSSEKNEIFDNAPDLVARALIDRREMLNEYFSLQISAEGELLSLPLLLKGYLPCLGKLPRFLLRLGPYVDWTSEEDCFRTFLRELAAFYTPEQLPPPPPPAENDGNEVSPDVDMEEELIKNRRLQIARMLEHVVFPALRSRLVATNRLLRGVVEVADLKGLYRVFERC
ncbi:hypothetical protein AFLA_009505 [Aspergillus flavus NRRL3357]|nr:hypothetical protein AFLA_009505 [Aspergillus flavus NRRL3357]